MIATLLRLIQSMTGRVDTDSTEQREKHQRESPPRTRICMIARVHDCMSDRSCEILCCNRARFDAAASRSLRIQTTKKQTSSETYNSSTARRETLLYAPACACMCIRLTVLLLVSPPSSSFAYRVWCLPRAPTRPPQQPELHRSPQLLLHPPRHSLAPRPPVVAPTPPRVR
jgi:hypothetical protein